MKIDAVFAKNMFDLNEESRIHRILYGMKEFINRVNLPEDLLIRIIFRKDGEKYFKYDTQESMIIIVFPEIMYYHLYSNNQIRTTILEYIIYGIYKWNEEIGNKRSQYKVSKYHSFIIGDWLLNSIIDFKDYNEMCKIDDKIHEMYLTMITTKSLRGWNPLISDITRYGTNQLSRNSYK